ncbi:uncharacterized protein LOC144920681 [Branchiostoma floridae x Branchiostoma belcheri]
MAEATNPKDVATNGSLIDAARNGNVKLVLRLLEAGAEVDKTDKDGHTPLLLAANEGHGDVVQKLLKAGANVNRAKQDGVTPLIIAACKGHVEVVQQLLKAGAEVNRADVNGFTPLFTAAQEGHVEVVQQLLKAGADVDKAKHVRWIQNQITFNIVDSHVVWNFLLIPDIHSHQVLLMITHRTDSLHCS